MIPIGIGTDCTSFCETTGGRLALPPQLSLQSSNRCHTLPRQMASADPGSSDSDDGPEGGEQPRQPGPDESPDQTDRDLPQDADSAEGFVTDVRTGSAVGPPATAQIELPKELPILPIRNAVAFPGTIMPLVIGRAKSQLLLKDVLRGNKLLGLVAQKRPDIDEPSPEDLYSVGTVAVVLKLLKSQEGQSIIVHGLARFRIVHVLREQPYLVARIEVLPVEQDLHDTELQALVHSVRQSAKRVIELSPNVPDEAAVVVDRIDSPSALADFLAANAEMELAQKQRLLETVDVSARLKEIAVSLANQIQVLELSRKIQSQVQASIDKTQRQYYLSEQLKAIQKELGESDERTVEVERFKARIAEAKMPPEVEKDVLRELDRISKIPLASPEYSVARTYLEWMCELPWSVSTKDRLDINRAERILNADHYNLQKVKKRILEFLAVRKLHPTGRGPILCFVGPPGVGKTSLGQSIARSLGRKFIRISLGGIRDEADIRGHRRTYIGALPGRIIQEIRKAGSNNPVFMLDELDKIGQDFRGDPASALLEVLDPEQNHSFTDHYIDEPFDLSRVMFIGTANYIEPVPIALRDRMEVIELPGYTENEKLHIARRYLIPRQMKENGLAGRKITFTTDAIRKIISAYTREAGVRNLERNIAAICRAIAAEIARGKRGPRTIDPAKVKKYLGPEQFVIETALRTSTAGVATGLAYTPAGGELIFVEATRMPGKGNLQLTGQIGDVMRESAQAAFSLLRSRAARMGIDSDQFAKSDIHVHVPAGAVPKDGPSAGVAIYAAMVSLMMDRPLRHDVAMTGEITLRGLILPVGGIKEKLLAAHRGGIEQVILPARNKKDLVDVPAEVRRKLKLSFVKTADEALKIALAGDGTTGGTNGILRSRRTKRSSRQKSSARRR